MKRRSNARLFAADGYTFKCWIDPEQARAEYDRGELDLALHPVSKIVIGFKVRESFESADPVSPRPSCCSITLSEMLLNVGIPPRSKDFPSREAILAAQEKIRVWPTVFDARGTRYAIT